MPKRRAGGWTWFIFMAAATVALGEDVTLRVDVRQPGRSISPYLTGACIEDVNHEIHGGLYSQMIHGESFQEPPRLKGFTTHEGHWRALRGEVEVDPGDGPKLVADGPGFADGEIGVEVYLPGNHDGNAGLIVKVDGPGNGADAFTGYEISLETTNHLVVGRHRRNWEPLRRVPCPVPVDRWITLVARLKANTIEVLVDGRSVLTLEDHDHPLKPGRVGLRVWRRPARFRDFWVKTGETVRPLGFDPDKDGAVSAMWAPTRRGTARGDHGIETTEPFAGRQSQRLTFREGSGDVGIENQGLNRWGMNFVADRPYEGYFWARADRPTPVALALESRDGETILAETPVEVTGPGWSRYDFQLTPVAAGPAGRFAIKLKRPGSIVVGHAFLQPGEWGRFRGLPVRRDVAEGLIDQGITVLRYGGSMVNHPGYRWKKMIGPRDRRPPGPGWWSPYSSNGWGIFDFLNFCEAAGFLAIPAIQMGESPRDMADFIEYANGPLASEWGRKRALDGHPEPYRLKHLELGNEEAVNEAYWEKFQPMAEAIWARDSDLILVVGDFAYGQVIVNPDHFAGGAAANSLAAHRKILELARARGREVWFDIHISTDHPPEPNGLKPERSYIDQLGKLAPGAKFKVVLFEYNSGNHSQKRALANALATNEVERVGDLLPIACAANALQPDGQNDNGWDQGLLFLNPAKVWLQPPGHVTRMTRRHYQPLLLDVELRGPADKLSLNAKRSADGKTLVFQVVNWDADPRPTELIVEGFTPSRPSAQVDQLAGPLEAANTADQPDRIKAERFDWRHSWTDGKTRYTFPPHSFTILRFE